MANYYNIDDILAEEEFVPVVFHKAANGVIIDPSSETNSVEQGAKVELPLWLAQDLYLRQAISISVPACFNQRTRLEIQADAACVDLKSRSPYFYEFGCKIAPLVGDKTIEILLLSAFKIRYKEILTKAYTAAYTTASKFSTLLTKEESNCTSVRYKYVLDMSTTKFFCMKQLKFRCRPLRSGGWAAPGFKELQFLEGKGGHLNKLIS